MRVTLRQLLVFDAIARAGSVSKAAEEIGLTQSSASASLQDLETNLGVELFTRNRRRLILNENGRRLHPKARSMLTQAVDLESAAGGTLQGTLRVGAGSTIGAYVLPAICAAFLAQHPQVRIDLMVLPSRQVLDGLASIQLDVGFVEFPVNRPRMNITPWFADTLVLVAAKGHRLAAKRSIRIPELQDETWFLQKTDSSVRIMFTTAILKQLGALKIGLETGSLSALKRAVASGTGIGCLSKRVVERELASGELVELRVKNFAIQRQFMIATSKEIYQGQLQNEFVRFAVRQQEA